MSSRQESSSSPACGWCSLGVGTFSSDRPGMLRLLTFTSVYLTFKRVNERWGGREDERDSP